MAFAAPRRPIGARALLPPPPRILESRPPEAHVVWACAASLLFGKPWAASSAVAGPRSRPVSAPLVARCRQRPDCCWVLGSPRRAGGAAHLTSKAELVLASGREMVVVSVPAEVTVILLDIEGTTTPIAFVKVRGGRERGSYLCLKTSEREIFKCCRFCPRGSGDTVVWLSVAGMGKRGCGGLRGCFSSRHHLLPRPCFRLDGEG